MKLFKLMTVVSGAAVLAAGCDVWPTRPDTMQAEFDMMDPVVATFSASQGLPGGPFSAVGALPFMGGMAFAGGPMGAATGKGPGAALPDNLKLTEAQRTAIQALVTAFHTANAADIAVMKAAHIAARQAHKAGKTRDEIRAILAAAKPTADRVHAAAAALRTAIHALLTAEQRAWLDAHKPDRPPRTP